jgi:hypothetical protein
LRNFFIAFQNFILENRNIFSSFFFRIS